MQKVSLVNATEYFKKQIICHNFYQKIKKKETLHTHFVDLGLVLTRAKQSYQKKINIPY